MSNSYLDWAHRRLTELLQTERDPERRKDYKDLIDYIEAGIMEEEDKQIIAKMIGVRNPSFDGDLIGWLDDDFTYDDPDEDDSAPKS